MTKRFSGELKWIDPSLLVTENKYDKTESFFLGLGVVFNDLRGFILFEEMLIDSYEKPRDEEVTSHAGHYGGVTVQIHKLIASTINEFFEFLKKHSDVFTTSEFKEILSRLHKSDRQFWESMVAAADGKFPNVAGLLKTVVQIRSNIAFHYDHSGKILRNAYISRFFGKEQADKSRCAYYSLGNTVEDIRFYFSDAAVEESLHIAAGKRPKESSVGDASVKKYQSQVRDTIVVMNATIASLLKHWLQSRRNRPHQHNLSNSEAPSFNIK